MAEHPWEREAGERDTAYQAFELFRRLGPDRTVQAAWEQYFFWPGTRRERGTKGVSPAPGYFKRWSARWDWHQRAVAWDEEVGALARDQELDRELKTRVAEQEEEVRQRQLMREETRAARAVGRRGLLRILQEIEGHKLDAMKLVDLIPHLKKFLEAITEGQRLERLEAGQSAAEAPQAKISDEQATALAIIVRGYVPVEKWDEVGAELDRALAGSENRHT